MSIQKFMTVARTSTAIQNDLANAGAGSLIEIAKSHGFQITQADIDEAKNHQTQVAYSCIEMYWTSVCSI